MKTPTEKALEDIAKRLRDMGITLKQIEAYLKGKNNETEGSNERTSNPLQ